MNWIEISDVKDFPVGTGINALVGEEQVAIFQYKKDEWYAIQNLCPHENQMILSRGLVGDKNGVPKVACPAHKKNFNLKNGECMEEESCGDLKSYPVKVDGDKVYIGA